MAETTTVPVPDAELFARQALYWANHFRVVCLLHGNNYTAGNYGSFNWVLAIDAIDDITAGDNAFEKLKAFQAASKTTVFGFLSYDLKNQTEHLQSTHADEVNFPELYFFKPRYIISIADNKVTVNRNYPETFELIELISNIKLPGDDKAGSALQLQPRTPKAAYLQNVEHIKQQIAEGDFYELNYCTEFYSRGTGINPVSTFLRLNSKAGAPFSCFFKLDDKYLLCASPERFIKKQGSKLVSQPIKGTIRKGDTEQQNLALQQQLQNDIKERAENVMIVDLVRNDLAKSAVPGTVQVEELFGVYAFNAINQMISTITATLQQGMHFTDAIKNAFPMGSMTGAPKVEVMKNIERYEDFKRGLYSGAVGYITAEGDFDLNVVIRSILYNQTGKYISVRAGGAITFDSDAEKEYAEVLLKAQGVIDSLRDK